MFDDFWKIDRSMGESRFAQVLGAVIMVVVIVGSIIYSVIR